MVNTKFVCKKLSKEALVKTWDSYRSDHNLKDRNILVEHYMPIAHDVATQIHARLPSEIGLDDLKSEGVFAIMQCLPLYDPCKKTKFETYVRPRVRGTILDWLRTNDWVPRLVRSRTAQVAGAEKQFDAIHGRMPNDEELAVRMEVTPHVLRRLKRDSTSVRVDSLSDVSKTSLVKSDSGRELLNIGLIQDREQSDPYDVVAGRDVIEKVMKGLSRSSQIILKLYHIEEMTMKQIGEQLGLSESRVSQMYGLLISRLRAQYTRGSRQLLQIDPYMQYDRISLKVLKRTMTTKEKVNELQMAA